MSAENDEEMSGSGEASWGGLRPARLEWGADGCPRSLDFDDIYFAGADGLAESRHVFLGGNNLPQAWLAPGRGHFHIAEIGFGAGLNFLATWQAWRSSPPPGVRLYFSSVEKHPLECAALERALAVFPELAELSAALVRDYPPPLPGRHRMLFDGGDVVLDLWLGDVTAALNDLAAQDNGAVDAWYLDGFAPARNPAMWSEALLQRVSGLSPAGATVATFSAAGEVRRRLSRAGFEVEKRPGFGRKREMLRATRLLPSGDQPIRETKGAHGHGRKEHPESMSSLDENAKNRGITQEPSRDREASSRWDAKGQAAAEPTAGQSAPGQPAPAGLTDMTPWHLPPRRGAAEPGEPPFREQHSREQHSHEYGPRERKARERKAIVLGAGLAGCTVAAALARRGWNVTVIDANTVAAGASGNRQGVLYCRLSHRQSALNDWSLHSFCHASRFYRALLDSGALRAGIDADLCGSLHLDVGWPKDHPARQTLNSLPGLARLVNPAEAERIAGLPLSGLSLSGDVMHGEGWDMERSGMWNDGSRGRLPNNSQDSVHVDATQDKATQDKATQNNATQNNRRTEEQGALFYPGSGWVSPAALCRALLQHPRIELLENTAVTLRREDNLWHAIHSGGGPVSRANVAAPGAASVAASGADSVAAPAATPVATPVAAPAAAPVAAPVAIVATGADCATHPGLDWLPLVSVRGQVSHLPGDGALAPLQTVLCHEGYVTPAAGGTHCVGATFDIGDPEARPRPADHRANLDMLRRAVPSISGRGPAGEPVRGVGEDIPGEGIPSTGSREEQNREKSRQAEGLREKRGSIDGWVGFRAASPDRLPIAGPVPAAEAFRRDYAELRHNARRVLDHRGTYMEGLYLSTAHGSRGLTSAPLAAELLAAQIVGEPCPVDRSLVRALSPARFLVRDLARNRP